MDSTNQDHFPSYKTLKIKGRNVQLWTVCSQQMYCRQGFSKVCVPGLPVTLAQKDCWLSDHFCVVCLLKARSRRPSLSLFY